MRHVLAVLLAAAAPLGSELLPLAPSLARTALEQAPEPELRVLLFEGPQVQLSAPQGAQLRDGSGRVLQQLPAATAWRLQAAATGLLFSGASDGETAPVPIGRELWIEPAAGGAAAVFGVAERSYRGRLRIVADGPRLRVINHVGLETYLASVVGSEMPASWPQQALRAQAVAARTYALRQRKPNEVFDLKATVASQVYKGLAAETASTREAVAATRSLVLTYRGELINAVFHSSSGGSTANSGEVWSSQLPYLVSVPDFDEQSPVREWQQPLPAEKLRQTFAGIGGVESIQVLGSSADGRIQQVRLQGPLGQVQLSGAELRSRLGLRSTWVRFEQQPRPMLERASQAMLQLLPGLLPLPPLGFAGDFQVGRPADAAGPTPLPSTDWIAIGRGFGHGVGMSQWGAYGLARRGEGFEQILRHFYRGVELQPHRLPPAGPVLAGLP